MFLHGQIFVVGEHISFSFPVATDFMEKRTTIYGKRTKQKIECFRSDRCSVVGEHIISTLAKVTKWLSCYSLELNIADKGYS